MPKVTETTLLRELPFSTIMKLGMILDPENQLYSDWRGMAVRIRKSPFSDDIRYSQQKIELIRSRCGKMGGSCTREILSDWGTTNTTVTDLVNIFRDMKHFQAIGILLGPEVEERERRLSLQSKSLKGVDDLKVPDDDSLPPFTPDKVLEYQEKELQIMTDNFNDYEVQFGGRLIGMGGFGKVYLGFFKNNIKCAVKVLDKDGVPKDAKIQKQYGVEFEALSNLKHKNLLVLLGYCAENLSLVFEFMPNGTLTDRLHCDITTTNPLSWTQRKEIMVGAAEGIQFLHERDYVHRDIKSPNILLDNDLVAKVSDFGLVRLLDKEKQSTLLTSTIIGTGVYMAPEALNRIISPLIDVYSFGIVILEVITGLLVIDEKREGQDIVSYIQDTIMDDEEILKLSDKQAGHVNDEAVIKLFKLSKKCQRKNIEKRSGLQDDDIRPSMLKVLQELREIQVDQQT